MMEQEAIAPKVFGESTEAAIEDYETDQLLARVEAGEKPSKLPVKKLTVVEAPFYSTGVAEVKVTRGGKEYVMEIPIRAVDLEAVEAFCRNMRPKVPTARDRVNGRWITILDEANHEYQQKLLDYQRILSRVWCLMAIDVDIEDESGNVVWSADNTVHDLNAAIKAMKKMGLVDSQFAAILRAARDLTQFSEEEIDRD